MNARQFEEFVQEIFIEAPVERVYQALTDPVELCRWWGDEASYRCTSWNMDLRVGGKWRADGVNAGGHPFFVEGEYVEIDPPTTLIYTWRPSWREMQPTKIRWQLNSRQNGTLVLVTHSGFAGNEAAYRDHENGLPSVLMWLRNYASSKS
jgi:uncharacterized protein YndB with AHSA1/START domain